MYNELVTLFFGENYSPNELELTFMIIFFFLCFQLLCGLIHGLFKVVR